MDPARRFMLAGLVVAAVEAALGVVALRTGLAPYLFACALATAGVATAARRLIALPPPDEGGNGPDGGGPRRPDDDPPPPWWPEFETEFRAHVAVRERRRQPVR